MLRATVWQGQSPMYASAFRRSELAGCAAKIKGMLERGERSTRQLLLCCKGKIGDES